MTKQEIVTQQVLAWSAASSAPNPRESQTAFIRWLIAEGHLPPDQAERSAARMVRNALEGSQRVALEASPLVAQATRHRIETLPSGDRRYVFYPRRGTAFAIAEAHVKAMKRAYAQRPHGEGATINQICRDWHIGRPEFVFIKTELGWTHDQDEYTRAEHLDLTTEQLLSDREQRSRWALSQAQREAEHRETARLAALGASFEARTDALRRALQEGLGAPIPRPVETAPADRLLVVPLADLHLGAPGTEHAVNELRAFVAGLPTGCAVLPVWLGDLFHVDTPGRTTTRGTPQETITPNPYELLTQTYRVGIELMQQLEQDRSMVGTIVVAGNHDEMSCYHWQHTLELLGYPVDGQGGDPMKVFSWGRELLLFEHGDGATGRPEKLVLAAMQRFRREHADTVRTHLFTGHLHHTKQVDVSGVMWHQLPSPEASSRWAQKKGYVARRGMQAFEFDSVRGLVRTYWHLFEERQ